MTNGRPGRDRDAVAAALRRFIVEELVRQPDYPLRDDEPLVSGGLIDSFALAHIGVFIEREFGVYIPDPELTVELMDSVDHIAVAILRRAE